MIDEKMVLARLREIALAEHSFPVDWEPPAILQIVVKALVLAVNRELKKKLGKTDPRP